MNSPTRPALRYYGGKWKLAPWVISFFPKHRVYVEPFGGAASVLLRKRPSRVEVYNDLSDEVVNLFRVLRDPESAAELRRLLDLTPYARTEWLAAYELHDDPIEQARRTILLSMMGYNASKSLNRKVNGFRSCSSGHHILPQDFKNYTEATELITHRLKNVIIENREAGIVIEQHDGPDTLHYVDPPYVGSSRKSSDKGYQHEMTSLEDHEKLAQQLLGLEGYVVLSGYASEEYRQWYTDKGWVPYAKDSVTGAAITGKTKRTEIVWLNPRAAAVQRQMRMF